MYRLTMKDEQGFTFAYYSDYNRDRCLSYAKSLTDNVTWEITYHAT